MYALANVLNTLLEDLAFLAYAGTMGGLVWSVLLLRLRRAEASTESVFASWSLALMRNAALGLAALQLLKLVTHAWVLGESFQRWPLPDYLYTLQCQAGLARALLAVGVALAATWLASRPLTALAWTVTALLTLLLAASGAWMSHAVGRSEQRAVLMAVTALHQFAVAVWLGGVIGLGLLWRLTRRRPEWRALWPGLVKCFAWVAGPAVLGVAATGLWLAWTYIATWQGLYGTDYGAMVLVKVMLLAVVLGFAALSFWGARPRHPEAGARQVFQRIPTYIEAETLLLVAIVFAAVSLSTQPPAIDMRDQHATWTEVWVVFRPKLPRLSSPSYAEAVAAFSSGASSPWGVATSISTHWSDYNHNVSGLFLVVTALLALVCQAGGPAWSRHWPLGFVALSAFIFLRSDADSTWPFGPTGFWESMFSNEEILLHRLGAIIACGLGCLEWRGRLNAAADSRSVYVVPGLCALGGLLLLGHAHAGFQPKEEFLIQLTHNAIGMLAVVMACGRWLELRLAPPSGRLAGAVSLLALLLIGMALLFYRETPIV